MRTEGDVVWSLVRDVTDWDNDKKLQKEVKELFLLASYGRESEAVDLEERLASPRGRGWLRSMLKTLIAEAWKAHRRKLVKTLKVAEVRDRKLRFRAWADLQQQKNRDRAALRALSRTRDGKAVPV